MSDAKELPAFRITNLQTEGVRRPGEAPGGIIHVTAPEYDETVSDMPDASLKYNDEDEDSVTVGSALELEQRLAENPLTKRSRASHGKLIEPYRQDGRVPVHEFNIKDSQDVQNVWQSFRQVQDRDGKDPVAERGDTGKLASMLPNSKPILPAIEDSGTDNLALLSKNKKMADTYSEERRRHHFNTTNPPKFDEEKMLEQKLFAHKSLDHAALNFKFTEVERAQQQTSANLTLEGQKQAQLAGRQFRQRCTLPKPYPKAFVPVDLRGHHLRWASYQGANGSSTFSGGENMETRKHDSNKQAKDTHSTDGGSHASGGVLASPVKHTLVSDDLLAPTQVEGFSGKAAPPPSKSLLEVFEAELAKDPTEDRSEKVAARHPHLRKTASPELESNIRMAISGFETCLRGLLGISQDTQVSQSNPNFATDMKSVLNKIFESINTVTSNSENEEVKSVTEPVAQIAEASNKTAAMIDHIQPAVTPVKLPAESSGQSMGPHDAEKKLSNEELGFTRNDGVAPPRDERKLKQLRFADEETPRPHGSIPILEKVDGKQPPAFTDGFSRPLIDLTDVDLVSNTDTSHAAQPFNFLEYPRGAMDPAAINKPVASASARTMHHHATSPTAATRFPSLGEFERSSLGQNVGKEMASLEKPMHHRSDKSSQPKQEDGQGSALLINPGIGSLSAFMKPSQVPDLDLNGGFDWYEDVLAAENSNTARKRKSLRNDPGHFDKDGSYSFGPSPPVDAPKDALMNDGLAQASTYHYDMFSNGQMNSTQDLEARPYPQISCGPPEDRTRGFEESKLANQVQKGNHYGSAGNFGEPAMGFEFQGNPVATQDGMTSNATLNRPFDALDNDPLLRPPQHEGLRRAATLVDLRRSPLSSLRRPYSEPFVKGSYSELFAENRRHYSNRVKPYPSGFHRRPAHKPPHLHRSKSLNKVGPCLPADVMSKDSLPGNGNIRECIWNLIQIGFTEIEVERLYMYAQAASGDLHKALDMISEDQEATGMGLTHASVGE